MIKEISQQAETRMKKSVEALQTELAKLRTGRARTSLLEHIKVEYYGSLMPLNQVANVAVLDARTLSVQPWEKNMVTVVEKAILESDLGLNPATSGMLIRIPLPALTEERRRELTKVLRNEGEKAKVAIRNIRRDSNNELKELLKEKAVTEDDERKSQEAIQKLTDKFIAEVETVLAQKEADLMTL